jgi:hypothetical protein
VHGPEYPAEVTWARKPPPGRYRRDRAVGQRRIGEILAAGLQPSLPDPARDSQALIVEELVQGAQGNVMGSGDHGR